MKNYIKRSLGLMAVGSSLISLINCLGNEGATEKQPSMDSTEVHIKIETIASDSMDAIENHPGIAAIEAPVPEPVVTGDQALVENPAIDIPITPLTAPMEFAKYPLDPTVNVPPWLANYVGSYGAMPSRFQNEGPFLYSVDISPRADIFQDDDENSRHGDDDF